MDPEIAADVRRANESSIMLVTLILEGNETQAAYLAGSDPVYSEAATCMAVAMLAAASIRTLARINEISPMDLIQVAGLSAAEISMMYENGEDDGDAQA